MPLTLTFAYLVGNAKSMFEKKIENEFFAVKGDAQME